MSGLEMRAGLGHTTVSRALNGTTVPSESTVVALAGALGTDVGPLLNLRRTALLPTQRQQTVGRKADVGVDGPFEERYRRYLEQRHGRLSIVGLDLSRPDGASWPLDAAYLSLEFAASVSGRQRPEGLSSSDANVQIDRAEQALAGKRRVLVRGLAGGGKTTLLQWLAHATATKTLPVELAHLFNCVPFVLPLRTVVRHGGPPSPAQFLEAVGCPLHEAQPSGWADRTLHEGRGLLLIDGLDEVPQLRRAQTLSWLHELLAAYPRANYVLTTRPSAVAEGWLAGDDFVELTVRPMSTEDVAVFVSRWHAAAIASTDAERERAQLVSLEAALKDAVRFERDLARMTTTPLLCALVCALHRDRRGHLPHSRMELYEAALSMLLVRRDRERDIDTPEGISLTEHQSVQLLQRLAYWLIRNGQTEMDHDTALAMIDDALPAMPHVARQGDASGVLRHLLARSGLLRTPAADTIDFIHRTFQDYLGARAAIEARDLPLLVRNASDSQWEDVLQMAVAHARPNERASLLRKLISRGDSNQKHRARLHLLAVACLEYATEIDPDVHREVKDRASALIPPRSYDEATDLAAVGPVILGLLPGPEDLEEDEEEAVIHTAELIGGDSALAVIKRFRSTTASWALGNAWESFDAHEYAQEVLAHASHDVPLTIKSREQLAELAGLQATKVAFRGHFTSEEIATAFDNEYLTYLSIDRNLRLDDLNFLSGCPEILRFGLHGCPAVTDLTPLTTLPSLNSLAIEDAEGVVDIKTLEGATGLDFLELDIRMSHRDLRSLPVGADITKLALGPITCENLSLDGIMRWPNLSYLSLSGPVDALPELVHLSNLEDLVFVGIASLSLLEDLPPLTQVREFYLGSLRDEGDLALVRAKLPNLHRLTIGCRQRSAPVDLTPLRGMTGLSVFIHNATALLGTENFPADKISQRPRPRV
jgi:transcriptional regulator with XRE-family HTH domain